MPFVRACGVADVPTGEIRRVELGEAIAVFNVDGDFFAAVDSCTHEEYPLSEGWLDGDVVQCPLHLATYCVRDGAALSLPAKGPLRVLPVAVEGDDVLVDLG